MKIKTIMTTTAISLWVLSVSVAMVGCSKEPSSDGEPLTGSEGSNNWHLGAVIQDGTNVSGTNVTVTVRPRAGKAAK